MPNRCQRIKVEPLDSAVCHCSAQSPPQQPGGDVITNHLHSADPPDPFPPAPLATNNRSCFQMGVPAREGGRTTSLVRKTHKHSGVEPVCSLSPATAGTLYVRGRRRGLRPVFAGMLSGGVLFFVLFFKKKQLSPWENIVLYGLYSHSAEGWGGPA